VIPEATTGHKRRFCLRSTLRNDEAQWLIRGLDSAFNTRPDLIMC
jgi:hypothetical protein